MATMEVTPVGTEDLVIDGQTVPARKFQMRGDIEDMGREARARAEKRETTMSV